MKKYRVEFQLGIWACEIEATNEDEAWEKAQEYASEDVGYDFIKHAEGNVEEIKV